MVIVGAERKIISSEEIKKILALFKEKLVAEKVPFASIYLFGSYATGEADRDSDIDIAVVISPKAKIDEELVDHWRWLAKEINVKTEVHIIKTEDFDNRYLSLPAYIKKDGIVV